jgi:hypothetical protein
MADTTTSTAGSKKLKGRVYVRAGGNMLAMAADSEVTVKYGGSKREPTVMNDGSVYYSETPVPAGVECTIKLLAGMTLGDIQKMDNVTVTVEADDGYTATLANAFCGGDLSLANKGGDVKVAFHGATLEESNGASS